MQLKEVMISMFIASLSFSSISREANQDSSMVKSIHEYFYYSGFYSNYRHPYQVRSTELITKQDAEKRRGYVRVRYDENGNLVEIEKIINDVCLFKFVYTYDKNGSFVGNSNNLCH